MKKLVALMMAGVLLLTGCASNATPDANSSNVTTEITTTVTNDTSTEP